MTGLRKATPNEGLLCGHDAGSKHIVTLQWSGPKRWISKCQPWTLLRLQKPYFQVLQPSGEWHRTPSCRAELRPCHTHRRRHAGKQTKTKNKKTQAFRFLKTRAAKTHKGKITFTKDCLSTFQPKERSYSKCRNEMRKENQGAAVSKRWLKSWASQGCLPRPSARSCFPTVTRSVRFAPARGRGWRRDQPRMRSCGFGGARTTMPGPQLARTRGKPSPA